MTKVEIPLASKCFFAHEYFNNTNKNILLCCADEEGAIFAYKQLLFFDDDKEDSSKILFFPSLDTVPYDRVLPSREISAKRADILTKLAKNNVLRIIVTASQNLMGRLPTPNIFANTIMELVPGIKLDIEELTMFLAKNGFNRVASAVNISEFAIRKKIVDLVTFNNNGYRINFAWDSIESIREFDTYSQISRKELQKLTISSANESLLNSDTIATFKNNFLQIFGVNYINSSLYKSITGGNKFHGYEHLMPLFYEEMCLLRDFLGDHIVIYDNPCIQSIIEHENSYDDLLKSRQLSNKTNSDFFYFAIQKEKLITSSAKIKQFLLQDKHIFIESGTKHDLNQIENIITKAKFENKTEFDKLFEIILENKKNPYNFM